MVINFPFSGEAVGIGAKCAAINALLKQGIANPNICKPVNTEGYYAIATRKAPINEKQSLDLRAFGLACMLYFATFELVPDPVSPALLQFAVGNLNSIIDIPFIREFAPETAMKLGIWPLDSTADLEFGLALDGKDHLTNLACEHLEMMVCLYLSFLFIIWLNSPFSLRNLPVQIMFSVHSIPTPFSPVSFLGVI